jgi:hypothetical protein
VRAFEVHLNGERLCLAGIGNDGVLNTMVDCVETEESSRRELRLRVGGLISPLSEHVTWIKRDVSVGDEICVRIVQVDRVDEPIHRLRDDPSAQLKAKKNYVRRVAKELGWKVSVPTSKRRRPRSK